MKKEYSKILFGAEELLPVFEFKTDAWTITLWASAREIRGEVYSKRGSVMSLTLLKWQPSRYSCENVRWNLYLKSICSTIYEQVLFIDKIVDWNWKQAITFWMLLPTPVTNRLNKILELLYSFLNFD